MQQRNYWVPIVCGAVILTLALGIRQNYGIFIKPILTDLPITRTDISFGPAMAMLLMGLLAPLGGMLADRYGSHRVGMAGAAIFVLGMAGIAAAQEAVLLNAGNILTGVGMAGAGFSTVLGAVGRAAPPEKRTLALGIASAGGSLGQFAVVPLGQALIDFSGWRMAMWALTLLSIAMIPLAMGLREAPKAALAAGAPPPQTAREALREAFKVRGYWLLTAGYFVCGFHVAFVGTHMPAYLVERGMPTWVGAAALSLVGLFNIVGTLAAGFLGNMFPRKNVLSLIYLLRSGAFLIFLLAPLTPTSVMVFSAMLGLLWLGTVPLTTGLVAYMFGPAWMAMLGGIVFMSHQLGSFVSVFTAGWLYDRLGNYDAIWWASVALGLISAALHFPIVERPVARLNPAAA